MVNRTNFTLFFILQKAPMKPNSAKPIHFNVLKTYIFAYVKTFVHEIQYMQVFTDSLFRFFLNILDLRL